MRYDILKEALRNYSYKALLSSIEVLSYPGHSAAYKLVSFLVGAILLCQCFKIALVIRCSVIQTNALSMVVCCVL